MQLCKDPMWKLCTGQSVMDNILESVSLSSENCVFYFPVTPCQSECFCLCPTEDMSWVAAETLAEGPTPEARIGHTAVYDPDSRRIFVFGGSKNKKWFNDVHILDTQSWKWTMVEVRVCFACFKSILAPHPFSSHPPPLSRPPRLKGRFLLWPTTAAACFGENCSCWEECFLVQKQSPTAAATHSLSSTPTSPSGTSLL